jgi:PAS domain S-box-containing protein
VQRANEALQGANERLEREVALRTRELRRKEWYLEEAERLSHTGSWTLDLGSGQIGFWSDEASRIFGIPPGSGVPTGDYLERFVHPKDLPYAKAARRAAIHECRSWDLQHRIVRPDGGVRYIHTVGQPSFDEHGQLVSYIGCVMDVTERRRMARALRRSREHTLRSRFQAQLAERNRIAREMHDTLLQGFTGVALKLVATANSLSELQKDNHELQELIDLTQRTLEDARNAISDIRAPSSSSDLPEALRMEAEQAAHGGGVNVRLEISGDVRPLPLSIVTVISRVAREAVTNVVRHATTDAVRLQLRYRRRAVRLTVSDEGRGFTVNPELDTHGGHFGLLGMRERAAEIGGRLMIESEPGQGTTVRLIVPI